MTRLSFTVVFWVLFRCLPVFGQSDALVSLRQALDKYRSQALQEKLFVHTDRSFYLTGETLVFKTYYVDGSFHRPLTVSKVAYLEIVDQDRKAVLQTKMALEDGNGSGVLYLPASLPSGNYLLRAYTAWMRNFSPDYFFEKSITIINPFKKLGLPPAKDSVDIDLQFFPEGGNLVSGLPGKVAYKVVGGSGKGLKFNGMIVNQRNDTLIRFQPLKFGMGRFSFTPAVGDSYRAVIRDERGRTVAGALPKVYERGYVMQVDDAGSGGLKVTVRASQGSGGSAYLLVHTRQQIQLTEAKALQGDTAIFMIPNERLGEGISHLTVFNNDRKPVCERLYFKRPRPQLRIEARPSQPQYASRSKASIDFSTADPTGAPLESDLSVSIYRVDSLQSSDSDDIVSSLWLTSDLRGQVESPGYYLYSNEREAPEAADNLMLTQGWRRFRWDEVLKKDSLVVAHIPEFNGHFIRGRLIDPATGSPVAGVSTFLTVPGRQIILYTDRSNATGQIKFEMKDFRGPREIIVQTMPKDTLYRIEIQSPFAETFSGTRLPAFALSEKSRDELLERSIAMQTQNTYFRDSRIRYQLPTIDSTAFYGKPDERYRLDDFTRFPVLEEVFREYVPGVQPRKRSGNHLLMTLDQPNNRYFEDNPLVLLDGVPVFDINRMMEFPATKIQRLEVMTRKYLLGNESFNGIISFTTYKGDLGGFKLNQNTLIQEYEGLQLRREFYTPKYDTPNQRESRLPDLRNQLFWVSNLKTGPDGKAQVGFFTSDQEGTYRVVVNGLTKMGRAGSYQATVDVKNTVK